MKESFVKFLVVLVLVFANMQVLHAQWGLNSTRSDYKNDAGAGGTGVQSGFYQAGSPVNYPAGATNWWHLLDVRHSEPTNNYAMQFAGSFFDQELYFRKTNNNPATAWSKVILETGGKVGIGTNAPIDRMQVNGPLRLAAPTGGSIAYTRISWGILPNTGASTFDNHRDLGNVGFIFRTTNNNSSFTELMRMHGNGNISIGTPTDYGYKLAVNGSAIFTKAVVKNYANWPDYVFDSSYELPSLESVSSFIKENKHLPEMPSASSIEKEGHDLGEVQKLLLKKVEELTLYIIEQDKKIKELVKASINIAH